ncbi:camphor resistance protein CrcB [Desulfopila aestuarii DSM 18488]|uniref:Fluoride-specific ion channel FluC n=2 Tax=Desulfopila aestuarii TaxID=231440 RepID=A0A1M7Y0I2_9BACT|nr:camphor resistance protein CrcB [Desulfopila aestuarii DSM 18488]
MEFNKLMAVAFGGAVGSIGRYCLALLAARLTNTGFPLGTFVANIGGCLLIGFCWNWFDRVHISNEFRLFIFTGFLGGFTTFSTFARESVQFFKAGEPLHALGYILASNVVGLGIVAAGFLLAEKLFRP